MKDGPEQKSRRKSGVKKINLALQGGGAHGAFTWGVLDRLLEEDDIEIEGVSATSAGAMNGAMLTTGMKQGGRKAAQERLETFWREIIEENPINQPPWSYWLGAWPGAFSPQRIAEQMGMSFNPAMMWGEFAARMVSPYQFNPSNFNPLRDALEKTIDFSKVCRIDEPRLFVCATDVRACRAHIFKGDDISVDALLASACLPMLFQAVTIDGREYWDGGYTGNPPIWPLIYDCACRDIMVVHVNPIERPDSPEDARGIESRVNEIAFNSNLMGEMRAIATINKLLDEGALDSTRYKQLRIHAVEDGDTMRQLGAMTKLTPDWRMIESLKEAGRNAMERWLKAHKEKLGVKSSVDIRTKYL